MENYIKKADILIEALPYIKEFNNSTVVIKYGGSSMTDLKIKEKVIEDIVLMKLVGMNPIIVHGGGKDITNQLNALNIETEFIDGIRVTTEEVVETAEMVLAGKVNKEIVSLLEQHNVASTGISGKDGSTLKVEKSISDKGDIGFVGKIKKVNPELINVLVDNKFIPVIAPVGTDESGKTYNINADHAACEIAISLKAEKLIYLTDTNGVLADYTDSDSRIPKIEISGIEGLIDSDVISGGMIPKVLNCKHAIDNGVHSVHILDGCLEHSLLLEIFTDAGIGTMMVASKIV